MPDPEHEPFPLIRRLLPVTSAAVVIAGLYCAFVFYNRWNDAREDQRARDAKEAADLKLTVDAMGGNEFKILSFYGSPGAIRRGDHVTICYGTNEAKTVRIDPPIEELHPVYSHCLQASPGKTTQYTLTAEDGKGHSQTQSFVITVLP